MNIIFILLYIIINIKVKIVYKYPKIYFGYSKIINYDDFLNMKIYFKESKGEHLLSIMNSEVIKDIIEFNKNNNLTIKEMNIKLGNNSYHNYHNFWNSGNNIYYYSMKYEFRKNVLDYHHISKYNGEYKPYSKDYYENLEEMNEKEISDLLYYKPIITYKRYKNYFKHGYHRIFAMIGRLINGKQYIPFYIITI